MTRDMIPRQSRAGYSRLKFVPWTGVLDRLNTELLRRLPQMPFQAVVNVICRYVPEPAQRVLAQYTFGYDPYPSSPSRLCLAMTGRVRDWTVKMLQPSCDPLLLLLHLKTAHSAANLHDRPLVCPRCLNHSYRADLVPVAAEVGGESATQVTAWVHTRVSAWESHLSPAQPRLFLAQLQVGGDGVRGTAGAAGSGGGPGGGGPVG